MFGKFAMFPLLCGALLVGCAGPPSVPESTASTAATANIAYLTEQSPPVSQWTETCEKWDDWDKPGPPYRIHGNTYYVGTCGIAAILVTSPDGHVLIDSGTRAGAQVVLANIEALGFDPSDIEILLMSHEHFDHVGGMQDMAAATGAAIIASPAAAQVIESGKDHPEDPQFGVHDPMAPVAVQRVLEPGQDVRLGSGSLRFTPIITPGHTPGALSWQWQSCADNVCKTIVYADSLSPVSSDEYRFSDHPDYVAAYRAGLERLAAADCDILTTPHPSSSGMVDRLASGVGLEDSDACVAYAASITARLDKRLVEEAADKVEIPNGG